MEVRGHYHHKMSMVLAIYMASHYRCYLCSFSITAVTTSHKLSSLNNKKLLSYISVYYKFNMGLTRLKSVWQQTCVLFQRPVNLAYSPLFRIRT